MISPIQPYPGEKGMVKPVGFVGNSLGGIGVGQGGLAEKAIRDNCRAPEKIKVRVLNVRSGVII